MPGAGRNPGLPTEGAGAWSRAGLAVNAGAVQVNGQMCGMIIIATSHMSKLSGAPKRR